MGLKCNNTSNKVNAWTLGSQTGGRRVACIKNDREGLEALARYCLRPPVAQGWLSKTENDSGKVVSRLKRPLADGRTAPRRKSSGR